MTPELLFEDFNIALEYWWFVSTYPTEDMI